MKFLLKLFFSSLLPAVFYAGAAEPVYVGLFRGPTNIMPPGLYSFTNLTDPAGSATRIGTAPFPAASWQKVAFTGAKYLIFVRTTVQKGPGLYECNGISTYTLVSTNTETGSTYTFLDWHGIGYCNLVYYGLYDGTNMTGAGLYRFTDPTDPESTAERLFPSQTFPASTWSDVDFDGERYLFTRTANGGTPGIYQYDPLADTFTCISGSETYTNWDGIGVYVAPVVPPPPAPLLHRKMYVILFGGQSNALGWGYHQYLWDTGDPLAFPQDDVLMFTGKGLTPLMNVLTSLQSGVGNPSVKSGSPQQYPALTGTDAIDHFGPELSLGRTVRDLIRIPNSKVAIIKYAASGTSIYKDWLPDGTTNSATDGLQYRNFQTTVWAGLAALQAQYPDYAIEILGMGWVQGESDTANGQSINYFSNLTNFVADIRATFGSNIVFALSKLSPNQNTNASYATVRAAQQQADDADPKLVATETIGTNYLTGVGFAEGAVHYLSSALLQIGRDLGNAIMTSNSLDADADGLPDAWENSYPPEMAGLGISPDADFDGDGYTDMQEYELGTSPVDPTDHLDFSVTGALAGRWAAKKDVRYQMLASTNLVSWAEIGDPILLRDSNRVVEVDLSPYLSPANRTGFFRLEAK